jgi:uncharacterized protein YcfJ
MSFKLSFTVGAFAFFAVTGAAAQITLYEGEGFRGRALTTNRPITDLDRMRERAQSVVVDRGFWEVCEQPDFGGRCVILRTGSYDSMRSMGLDDVASVRSAQGRPPYPNEVPAPLASPNYQFRQRPQERLYQAPVTSVRAVLGPPEQRCWVERQEVVEPSDDKPNVGGAVAGAIIGGILGHQVGGKHEDAATAGGAIAGAAIGSQVGRDGGDVYSRDVQRCQDVPSGPPEYWEVTYNFRGYDHVIEMSAPPGPTITVNREGEPRQ